MDRQPHASDPQSQAEVARVIHLLGTLKDDITGLRLLMEQTSSNLHTALAGQAELFRRNLEDMLWTFLKSVASTLAKAVFSAIALSALAYVWASIVASWRH